MLVNHGSSTKFEKCIKEMLDSKYIVSIRSFSLFVSYLGICFAYAHGSDDLRLVVPYYSISLRKHAYSNI